MQAGTQDRYLRQAAKAGSQCRQAAETGSQYRQAPKTGTSGRQLWLVCWTSSWFVVAYRSNIDR